LSTKAYVLIETSVGKTTAVSDALLALPAIVSVDAVTGHYDIIAVVDAADLTAVGNLVTSDIHTIGGIVRTVTCLSMGSAI